MKKKKNKKQQKPGGFLRALAGGLAGAVTVTVIHETMRRLVPDAPRMDVLGMRAIAKGLNKANEPLPEPDNLHTLSLIGDLVANSLYYSLTGGGKNAWVKGSLLGLAAGVGGVVLPGPMGLGTAPSNRTTQTQAMTVAWYLLGGVAAAGVVKYLACDENC